MAGRKSGARKPLLDLLETAFPHFSRDELYRFVMCAEVRVNGATETDPRRVVPADATCTLLRRSYVSRGGEKLQAALDQWSISASGRVWLDAGASTGGFTDCLLQYGAAAVHAVDVGYNQLDYRLRRDARVFVHERTNIGHLEPEDDRLAPPPTAAVCDLSFRSLRGVLRHILALTTEGWGIALVKPQFELAAERRWARSSGPDDGAEPEEPFDGVVDEAERGAIVTRVVRTLDSQEGVRVHAIMDSPIRGRGGNREVLVLVGLTDRLHGDPANRRR